MVRKTSGALVAHTNTLDRGHPKVCKGYKGDIPRPLKAGPVLMFPLFIDLWPPPTFMGFKYCKMEVFDFKRTRNSLFA